MKKSDLKSGMIIELRDKSLYLLVGETLMGYDDYVLLNGYNDDLTDNDNYKDLDIVKVYDGNYVDTLVDFRDFCKDTNDILWDRKNEIDFAKLDVNTLLEINIENKNIKMLRYFAKFEENIVYVFAGGADSITAGNNPLFSAFSTEYVKLYEK